MATMLFSCAAGQSLLFLVFFVPLVGRMDVVVSGRSVFPRGFYVCKPHTFYGSAPKQACERDMVSPGV